VGLTTGPCDGLGLGEGICATICGIIEGLPLGAMLGAALGGIWATADIEGLLLGMPLAIGLGGVCRLGAAAVAASPVWGRTPTASTAASVARPILPIIMR
jgi:hypothetical protein